MPRIMALLIAVLALVISPIAMATGGMAMAQEQMPPTMEMDGHCADADQSRDEGRCGIPMACAAACAALHPTSDHTAARFEGRAVLTPLAHHRALNGIQPEGDTPPPRVTLEI